MNKNFSNYLFAFTLISGIANSLIKVFISLIIFKNTQNLTMAIVFCVIDYALTSFLFFVLRNFIKKHSALSLVLHIVPVIIINLIMLTQITWITIVVLAILDAIDVCLYYSAKNIIFVGLEKNNNVAKFEAGGLLGKIIFTVLSAYVLGNIQNSIYFVVITASVLYMLSLVPIFMQYKNIKSITQTKSICTFVQTHDKYKKFNFYHFFSGSLSFLVDVFLPLYLYAEGISFSMIGIVVSINFLLQIGAGYLAKMIKKKQSKRITFVICSLTMSACACAIFICKSYYVIYALFCIINVSYKMIFVLMFENFSARIKGDNTYIDALAIRDIYQNASRSVFAGSFLIIPNFICSLVLGVFSGIGMAISSIFAYKDLDNNAEAKDDLKENMSNEKTFIK